MDTAITGRLIPIALCTGALVLAACDIKVEEGEGGKQKNVDIRTPIGDVSVRTDVEGADTGLPVYPGAQPVKEEGEEGGSADVNIGTSFFGIRVVAAKYRSDDAPGRVVDFYRNSMQPYGAVTECRGDYDFEGDKPVCDDRSGSGEIQLIAGTESEHRVVSVSERADGSEFAVVSIQIRDKD